MFSLLLAACQQPLKPSDLSKINGYWEIEQVILPDGNRKEYKINETVDYFVIKNDSGFRKKVKPQFDGKYLVNDESEQIKIVTEEGKTYIAYTTDYAKWTEEIITITDENLVLKNEQDLEYHYKKHLPFSVK